MLLIIKLTKQKIIETILLFRLTRSLVFTTLDKLTCARQFKEY